MYTGMVYMVVYMIVAEVTFVVLMLAKRVLSSFDQQRAKAQRSRAQS